MNWRDIGVPVEQVADTLDKAADYIEAHGHCKSNLETPDGRVCAIGAINRVVGMRAANFNMGIEPDGSVAEVTSAVVMERQAAFYALQEWTANLKHPGITVWNDHQDTTADDVVNGIRKAANETREKVT